LGLPPLASMSLAAGWAGRTICRAEPPRAYPRHRPHRCRRHRDLRPVQDQPIPCPTLHRIFGSGFRPSSLGTQPNLTFPLTPGRGTRPGPRAQAAYRRIITVLPIQTTTVKAAQPFHILTKTRCFPCQSTDITNTCLMPISTSPLPELLPCREMDLGRAMTTVLDLNGLRAACHGYRRVRGKSPSQASMIGIPWKVARTSTSAPLASAK
jgi:hypothetical protein